MRTMRGSLRAAFGKYELNLRIYVAALPARHNPRHFPTLLKKSPRAPVPRHQPLGILPP
jgi:hypothetical protein